MSQIFVKSSPYYQPRSSIHRSSHRHYFKQARLKFIFEPSMAIAGLISLGILISFLYLVHFNQVATRGYDMKRLEVDRQQLLEQYETKNAHLSRAKSLDVIAQSNRAGIMVKATEPTFVRGDTAVALKEK